MNDKNEKFMDNIWEKYGRKRLYLDMAWMCSAIGLEYTTYKTGNISWASMGGETISNSKCGRILGYIRNAYYDMVGGRMVTQTTSHEYDEIRDNLAAAVESNIG